MLLGASAYSAPLARLGKIRSAGITDLRFGNLVDEDWNKRDRFERSRDLRVAVPLPEGVACYAIAATTGKTAGDLGDRLIGDGIVPLASALGHHANPRLALTFDDSRQWVAYGTNHLDLLSRPGSLRADQAVAGCIGLSARIRLTTEFGTRKRTYAPPNAGQQQYLIRRSQPVFTRPDR